MSVLAALLALVSQTAPSADYYSFTLIADSTGPLSDMLFRPVINNKGTVAFTAFSDEGGAGIYRGSGGELTTIYASSGGFVLADYIAINDCDTVAFAADLGPGPASTRAAVAR